MICWRKYLFFLFITLSFSFFSQVKSDFEFLKSHKNYVKKYEEKRKVEYLFKGRNAFVKYNPVSLFFGGALFVYQSTISKQIGASCPYEYNCSNFSRLCIRKYGLFKGICLTADRLTRCTRMAAIDIDPYVDIRHKTNKIIDSPEFYSHQHHD